MLSTGAGHIRSLDLTGNGSVFAYILFYEEILQQKMDGDSVINAERGVDIFAAAVI